MCTLDYKFYDSESFSKIDKYCENIFKMIARTFLNTNISASSSNKCLKYGRYQTMFNIRYLMKSHLCTTQDINACNLEKY